MKTIYITLFLCFVAILSNAQKIDENGREIGISRTAKLIPQPYVALDVPKTIKFGASFNVNFALPEGKKSGKLKVFNPLKDEELKVFDLAGEKGQVVIQSAEFKTKGLVLGLYSDENLIAICKVGYN